MPAALYLDTDGIGAPMSSEEAVSLREYLERLLDDQRVYFERLVAEHGGQHAREREAAQRAIDEARARVEQRLQALNELRAEVTEDRGQLVQRTAFDAKTDAADKERGQLRDELAAIRADLANQRGRQAAYAVVLTIALVIIPVLIQFLLRGG